MHLDAGLVNRSRIWQRSWQHSLGCQPHSLGGFLERMKRVRTGAVHSRSIVGRARGRGRGRGRGFRPRPGPMQRQGGTWKSVTALRPAGRTMETLRLRSDRVDQDPQTA